MPDVKQDNIHELRKKLKAYVSQAKENEVKLQKMQQQELNFISAESIEELLHSILNDYRHAYHLDYVSLLLIDPDHEIRHIIEIMNDKLIQYPNLIFSHNHSQLESFTVLQNTLNKNQAITAFQKTLFPDLKEEPYLGSCSSSCKDALFPDLEQTPESIAILPLIRNHNLIGSLNLASFEPQRFLSGSATDFMKRLSAILAVCIENAINNEKLKLLGLTDALTGIHNRRYYMQRLNEEISRVYRHQQPLSCLFLDIDNFKAFNDIYGHSVGDQVLCHVANILKQQMRNTDVLARYGGEEFSILLVDTEKNLAQDIAERIRLAVETATLYSEEVNEELGVTVSIGFTILTSDTRADTTISGDTLLHVADHALYAAKSAGRNCVYFTDLLSAIKAQPGA